MTGKSLWPLLQSSASGQVEAARTSVVLGRERHVWAAREGCLPYPQRAIRTRDFLYVHNFAPDRWPIGDPQGLDDPTAPAPSFDELCNNTRIVYSDIDGGPTKAWMIHHRAEASMWPLFELSFGKRPREELYDLRVDPDYMHNLAADPAYDAIREELAAQLMGVLREQADPRLVEEPCRFEHPPYAGPVDDPAL